MRIILDVIKGPHEGRQFSFEEHDNFIVGRAKAAHFRLPIKDEFFSRIHFMVEINPPLCRLLDMQSTNGTIVNGRKVTTADLKDGDQIKAGKTVIRITLQDIESRDRDEELISEPRPLSINFEHQAQVEQTLTPSADYWPGVESTEFPTALAPDAGVCQVCD